jgi:putative aldouronate transport system permease protein
VERLVLGFGVHSQSVALSTMTQGMGGDDMVSLTESIRYATIIVSTLPILTVYPFLQKYFASGVMIGAIKG